MAAKSNHSVRFSSLFTPAHVICQTELTERNLLLMEMLHHLAMVKGIGNIEEAYNALIVRENEIPTVVGPGIAMPHVRLAAINHIMVGIATSKNGIKYAANIDNPIKLIILTLANIVALGMAERHYRTSIKFFEWLMSVLLSASSLALSPGLL